jgi:hypothetical protein
MRVARTEGVDGMNAAKRSVGALLALGLVVVALLVAAIAASATPSVLVAIGGVGVLLIVGGGLFLFAGRRRKAGP